MDDRGYQVFVDTDATALEGGKVYIGTADMDPQTSPINLFWDEAKTIPAAQPLLTAGGVVVRDGTPTDVFADKPTYSIRVRNRAGAAVWYKSIAGGSLPANRMTFPIPSGPKGEDATPPETVDYIATAGQTTFPATGELPFVYDIAAEYLAVYVNGVKLLQSDFTVTEPLGPVVLASPMLAGATVSIASFTADGTEITADRIVYQPYAGVAPAYIRQRLDEEFDLHLARQTNADDDNDALAETQNDGRLNLRMRAGKGTNEDLQGAFRIGISPYADDNTTLIPGNITKSGTRIQGDKRVRVDQMGRGFMFNIATLSPDPADNLTDIEITGMILEGMVERDGFEQFAHMIGVSGATRLKVTNNVLRGARGDDVAFMSTAKDGEEAHNVDCEVSGNFCDGLIKDSRCFVSVVDCDGLAIFNNTVTRKTRPGGFMTGPIDVEPEDNAFHVARRVAVNYNRFYDNNGSALALLLKNPEFFSTPCRAFQFIGNIVEDMVGGLDLGGYGDTTTIATANLRYDLTVAHNQFKNVERPMRIAGGWFGLDFHRNIITDADAIELGNQIYGFPSRELYFHRNRFVRAGRTRGPVFIQDARTIDVEITENRVHDCGRSDGVNGQLLLIRAGDNDVRVSDNRIYNPNGRMKRLVQKDTGTDAASSQKVGNQVVGTALAPDSWNPPAPVFGVTGTNVFGSTATLAAGASQYFDTTVPGAQPEMKFDDHFTVIPGATGSYVSNTVYANIGSTRTTVVAGPAGMTFPGGTVLTVTQRA